MSKSGHNHPPVVLELDRETAEFLLRNCKVNIHFALGMIQRVSRPTAEKLVAQIEQFGKVRDLLRKADPTLSEEE